MRLHEAIWQRDEAIDPDLVEIGNIYMPPFVSAMIETLYNQLRYLHGRDRAETAKIPKFKKKANDESDEDFKAEAETSWKKIDSVNYLTKKIITVYQGRIRSVVEDC